MGLGGLLWFRHTDDQQLVFFKGRLEPGGAGFFAGDVGTRLVEEPSLVVLSALELLNSSRVFRFDW